jgi:hypothetical protein
MRKPPGGEIKEKEMDKSCSTHKAHEKYNLAWKHEGKGTAWETQVLMQG